MCLIERVPSLSFFFFLKFFARQRTFHTEETRAREGKAFIAEPFSHRDSGLGGDPIAEGGNFGVDAWVSGPCAAVAPRDEARETAVDGHRAARVALAGILSTLGQSGAYLAGRKAPVRFVGLVARALGNDRHGDRLKYLGRAATFRNRAPSSDDSADTYHGLFVLLEQLDGLAGRVQLERSLHSQHGHVVLRHAVTVRIVILVHDYLGNAVGTPARGFGRGSSADREPLGWVGHAVGGRHHPLVRDDAAAAEAEAETLKGYLVGHLLDPRVRTADYLPSRGERIQHRFRHRAR